MTLDLRGLTDQQLRHLARWCVRLACGDHLPLWPGDIWHQLAVLFAEEGDRRRGVLAALEPDADEGGIVEDVAAELGRLRAAGWEAWGDDPSGDDTPDAAA